MNTNTLTQPTSLQGRNFESKSKLKARGFTGLVAANLHSRIRILYPCVAVTLCAMKYAFYYWNISVCSQPAIEVFLLSLLSAPLLAHFLLRPVGLYTQRNNLLFRFTTIFQSTPSSLLDRDMSDAPNSSTIGNSTGQCTGDNSKLDVSTISKRVTAAQKVPKSPLPLWSHEPTTLTLIWLAVAIPVVFLDASFILLRPHTFAGGQLHSSLWKPWDIYQKVDYVYARSVFNERDGWPSAQALFNVIETSCYVWYVLSVVGHSVWKTDKTAELEGWHLPFGKRTVTGRRGVAMAMVLCGATMVTVVKTALYCMFPSAPLLRWLSQRNLTTFSLGRDLCGLQAC